MCLYYIYLFIGNADEDNAELEDDDDEFFPILANEEDDPDGDDDGEVQDNDVGRQKGRYRRINAHMRTLSIWIFPLHPQHMIMALKIKGWCWWGGGRVGEAHFCNSIYLISYLFQA